MRALDGMNDDARVWVFGSAAPLAGETRATLERELGAFVGQWKSHGKALPAAVDILHDRFVAVAMLPEGNPSGCSVDKLYGVLKRLESETGILLLDNDAVFYRDSNGAIASASRNEFREMAKRGEAAATTLVFDLTVDRVGDLRRGGLEKPAAASWHGAAFGVK